MRPEMSKVQPHLIKCILRSALMTNLRQGYGWQAARSTYTSFYDDIE